jgi:hypothetical protein
MNLIGDTSFKNAIVVQGSTGSGKSGYSIRLASEYKSNIVALLLHKNGFSYVIYLSLCPEAGKRV